MNFESEATVPVALATTSIVAFLSGIALGVYSMRGYLISPSLSEWRRRNLHDPYESSESEVDDDVVLDHAPNWANGEDADMRDGLRQRKKGSAKSKKVINSESAVAVAAAAGSEECKLVLVVRTDLGMTKGKIAAQCGHATLACYKSIRKAADRDVTSSDAKVLRRWERSGQAKIALQAKGQDTLLELQKTAHNLGITAEVIQDAGRTQIDPGSMTVLGVGPAPKSIIDKVTGDLKLL